MRSDATYGTLVDGVRAAPGLMLASLGLNVANGLAAGLYPLTIARFVDAVDDSGWAAHGVPALATGVLLAASWYASVLDANLGFGLSDRADLAVSTRVAACINRPAGIGHLEREDYLRELDLVEANRYGLASFPHNLLVLVQLALRLLLLLGLAVTVHPALALLLLFGLAPVFAQVAATRVEQAGDEEVAEGARLAEELFALATGPAAAKELRVYGLADEIQRRHEVAAAAVSSGRARAAARAARRRILGWSLFLVGFGAVLALVVGQAVAGDVSAGRVVLAVVLAQQVRLLLAQSADCVAGSLTGVRAARRLAWLEAYADDADPVPGWTPAPGRLTTGIRLEGVSFRYGGSDGAALGPVELELPAGSTVALVGENGAGKSTVVKLLCRMHEPSTGSISVDGVPLESYQVDGWRSRTSATWQDFARFELRASETVGVGDLARHDDVPAIRRAVDRAEAGDVVRGLRQGLATPLGRSFVDGQELSGGQWQRLAVARGMMRDEPLLLLLDEPAASLDAAAEHAIFERYLAAARRTQERVGGITLLVTHRFSTARLADVIVVMADGRVVEAGSHAELTAAGGLYAELFALQAEAYR